MCTAQFREALCVLHSIKRHCGVIHSVERHYVCMAQCREVKFVY